MKKVLLIGDSIRLSYQDRVVELLAERATVSGPSENCRFSAFTLFNLSSWAPDADYDVIHWNNGQWDTCHMPDGAIHTPLDSYLEFQARIARILKPRTRRLIYATTTPVWPEQFESGAVHPRRNADIDAYNAAAKRVMQGLDVEINDLNAVVAEDIKTYISEDMVHLTAAGVECCASRVAGLIAT